MSSSDGQRVPRGRRMRVALRPVLPFAAAGLLYGTLTALAFPPFGLWGFAVVAPWPLVWAAVRVGRREHRSRSDFDGTGGQEHRSRGDFDGTGGREHRSRGDFGGTEGQEHRSRGDFDGTAGLRPVWAGVAAAAGSAPMWAIEHAWVIDVSAVGYPFLIVLMAIYPALFVWSCARVVRALPRWPLSVIVAVCWVGVEYLRGAVVWTGYPWYLAGQPLIDAPGVWRAASWGGAYGVSLLVALIAGAAADGAIAWRLRVAAAGPSAGRSRLMWCGGATAMVAVVLMAALVRGGGNEPGQRVVRVGIVQPNISMDRRILWDGRTRLESWVELMELTLRTAEGGAELIVWPETVFPGGPLNRESVEAQRAAGMVWVVDVPNGESQHVPAWSFAEALEQLQADVSVPMLVGAVATQNLTFIEEGGGFVEQYDTRFNSVFLVDGGAVDPRRYDKLHLTPWGEVIPYISMWPWLERQFLVIGARGMSFDLSAGRDRRVFEVRLSALDGGEGGGSVRVVTPICFEATMSRVCRRLVFDGRMRRADVMVNVTNDGWFGFADWGRQQHLLAARWRCAELATPMVRAANTGVSAVIDDRGRVRSEGGGTASLDPRRAGYMSADIRPGSRTTLYVHIGDVVGQGSLALWLTGVALALVSASRRAR